jgi:hypothetical protein
LVGCEGARLYSKEKKWETQGKETKGGGKERFKKKVKVLYVVMFTSLPRQNLMNCHVQEQK